MTIKELITKPDVPLEIKDLFQEIINNFDSQKSRAWLSEWYLNEKSGYKLYHHTRKILKQGKVVFDKPTHKLTSKELVLLYQYYYFPMHFMSSYWLYDKFYPLGLNKYLSNTNPIFIDFGCGTFTSGVALSSVIKKHLLPSNTSLSSHNNNELGVYYIGIDNSQAVLEENIEFLKFNQNANDLWNCYKSATEHRYTDFFSIVTVDKNSKVFDIIDEYLLLENLPYRTQISYGLSPTNYKNMIFDQFSIILNFSYLFGSDSLNVDELLDYVNRLILKYQNLPICAFYQNTTYEQNNKKWYKFKEKVFLKSILPKHQTAPIPFYKHSDGVLYDVLTKNIPANV